jgi:hypothetical protein
MTLDQFRATLSGSHPPDVSPLLRALWHDAQGDWDRAHTIAQDIDDVWASWCMRICTAKKAIPATRPTGIAVRVSLSRPIRLTPSGRASLRHCSLTALHEGRDDPDEHR